MKVILIVLGCVAAIAKEIVERDKNRASVFFVRKEAHMGKIILAILGVAAVVVEEVFKKE